MVFGVVFGLGFLGFRVPEGFWVSWVLGVWVLVMFKV